MTDHSKKMYYEVIGSRSSDDGPYGWKVYHYDSTGNKEVLVRKSDRHYSTREEAEDAAVQWCENNNVDADMA